MAVPPAGIICPPMRIHTQLAVIGGGPAGLRAAEVAAEAGVRVTLFDGKPSVGRKFLVAGKGGLNLTHGEAIERFVTRYAARINRTGSGTGCSRSLVRSRSGLGRQALGVETFQATSGRVYPKALKAAPCCAAGSRV